MHNDHSLLNAQGLFVVITCRDARSELRGEGQALHKQELGLGKTYVKIMTITVIQQNNRALLPCHSGLFNQTVLSL